MKRTLLILTAIMASCTVSVFSQMPAVQQKAVVLKTMVQRKHYSPRMVDDSFSVSVFNAIIESADPRRLLFTAPEFQQLSVYKEKLDDEINGTGWAFLDKFSSLYKNAVLRADSIVSKLSLKPFDYTAEEILTQGRRKAGFNFSADNAALLSRWGRYLKYRVLDDLYDIVSDDSTGKSTLKSVLAASEAKTRENIRKAEIKALKKISEHTAGFNALVTEMYLNAVATSFDPHTNYFSPQGKEQFQAELSTEGYFFGIAFEENENGQVAVGQLTPGGPAWKSGEINEGDELVSLLWEGKTVQDMTGASLDEVYEVLDQSNHDKLMFRFKKADGTMSNVMLRKEKTENEENIVKSFVLKGEKKIGYILLPGFYTEWENETGSSCANDVAKEILKLKKENIEGLILDVRYNGGGSLGEAMEMTGIFIEEGPLAAEKLRDGKVTTLKDPNRGTIYDGPMALMINGQSASASEVLAASLQDYNRAVIIGSNTYGKATMQRLFPMDTVTSRTITGNENRDAIKITEGKLYRVNGGTSQLNGVAPHIVLPDAFDGLNIGEKHEDYALPADSVKRNNYYKPLPALPAGELAQRSAARVAAHPDFQVIKKIVEEQKKAMQAATRTIPLKAELFEKWAAEQELNLELMKGEAAKADEKFVVENHAPDKQFLKDEYSRERNRDWMKALARDIYIQEAFMVLADLINIQKKAPEN